MPSYRRAFISGGTWFFTVNLLRRRHNDLLIRERHSFQIDAWVILPEHLHCVWTLPPGDSDFSMRWRLIKSEFSPALPKTERRSEVRKAAGERGTWQRHYWEHFIRDDADYQCHVAKGIYSSDWCGDINCVIGPTRACASLVTFRIFGKGKWRRNRGSSRKARRFYYTS
jgi:putative transposase